MPERLTCLDVAQVYLDEGELHRQQRVTQCHAGVGKTAGVEDQKIEARGLLASLFRALLYAIDQLVLGVALERHELMPSLPGKAGQPLLDGGEGIGAIDGRL